MDWFLYDKDIRHERVHVKILLAPHKYQWSISGVVKIPTNI